MRIDEPRHDPLSGRVDDLHVVPVFEPDIAGEAPRAFDAITLDHNSFIPERRIPSAVDQGSVRNDDRLFTMSAHVTLLWSVKNRHPSRSDSSLSVMRFIIRLYHGCAYDRNEKKSPHATREGVAKRTHHFESFSSLALRLINSSHNSYVSIGGFPSF
jgi:hypothetical protein